MEDKCIGIGDDGSCVNIDFKNKEVMVYDGWDDAALLLSFEEFDQIIKAYQDGRKADQENS